MNWSLTRRETGLIEHGCEHGVGHPNVASTYRMDYLDTILGFDSKGTWGVHGCDGCCSRPDFPGNIYNTLIKTFELYEEKDRLGYLEDLDGTVANRLGLIHEFAELDEPVEEQMRQAGMDFIKLQKYLQTRDQEWHDFMLENAEFAYWGLKALQFADRKIFMEWMGMHDRYDSE